MLPFLAHFTFFGAKLAIPTYGALLATAFFLGYRLCMHYSHLANDRPEVLDQLFVWVLGAALVGARLFHVFFEGFSYYRLHPLDVFFVWRGGYTFYGAMMGALVSMILFSRYARVSFRHYADMATPATALGLGIGRIGCFAAGCCWGKPTHVPWAVTYSHVDSFCPWRGVPLHPTQLYESAGAFVLALFLHWFWRRRQYEGQVLFVGLVGYAVLRILVEIFRGDDYRGLFFGGLLSYSQALSLFFLALGFVGLLLVPHRPLSHRS